MSRTGHNTNVAPHRLGCRLSNENNSARFKNPLLRVWCSKDKPPKEYVEVDRLDEMPKYYGYYEQVTP